MTLSKFLSTIRAHWLLVLAAAAVGGLGAGIVSTLQAPVYEGTVQLFVSVTGRGADTSQLNQGNTFSQQRTKSYAAIVNSPEVTRAVAQSLHLPYTAEDLAKHISTTNPLDTVLLDITVRDTSPDRARDIANAVAAEFPRLVDRIETPAGENTSPVKISVTQAATTPTAPVSPRLSLNLAIGLILGFTLGTSFAVLRTTFDRTIRSKLVAAEIAGASVLGSLPDESKGKPQPLIIDESSSPRAEAFRQLRTNIRFLSVDRQLNSIVVTGSLPEEGKTTTAANLAIALAQAGQPVALIDADLRKPSVAELFALPSGVGLTNVLLGDVPVRHALQPWRPDLPLFVLTSGPKPPNPSELLASARLKKTVESLVASHMMVIFDSPPLLPVTDAAIVAQATDGALMVTRIARTRTDQFTTAIETLRTVGATVLGVVANREKKEKKEAYGTYYHAPSPRRYRATR
ncbi:polysaccharide biosynthesis tyrosine autokinase [Planosporangium thailandense]|uniref:Polysaccharide biosynthesis tyrosine autokinase n=1 Tax=Planosporangium thailandense TaxID=765197 RepID=A0ABX0XY65_9ACTN|nr:polysaccharide biosynthesis tyrosine autokinase [Planosporangium thailandense]NJC70978.1 polysaccharide biosynthesis tyrosine autokinase [Planosporangium thailandense]